MENTEITSVEQLNEIAFTYQIGDSVKLVNDEGDVDDGYITEVDLEEKVITVKFSCQDKTKRYRSMSPGSWKTDDGE